MRDLRRLLAAFAMGALAWTAEHPALACQGPYAYVCSGAGAVAAPANAQMFVFRAAYDVPLAPVVPGGLRRSTKPPVLHLTDALGRDVPFSLAADANLAGYWLVRPAVTIAAGEKYRLRWDALCSAAEIATSVAFDRAQAAGAEIELTVPAAAPAPALGTLQIAGPIRRANVLCSCDVTAGPFEEVGINAYLTPSAVASLAPYAGMTSTQTILDGVAIDEAPWAKRATGCFGDGVLKASCTPGVETGITPGTHRVALRVAIAGTSVPLVVEQTVNFDCNAPTRDAPDGGTAAPDAGRDSAIDAGDAGSPASSPSSSSSCAIGATLSSQRFVEPAVFPVFLLASLLLAFRRRVRA